MKNNIFIPGDIIEQKHQTPTNNQKLEIDFIDYTRDVYIFKKPWIHSLSKHTFYKIEMIDALFNKV